VVTPDGTLWFKTHGHSMHVNYVVEGEATIFPHDYPPLKAAMGLVFDAAAHAGADVEFLTAGEAYQRFVSAPPLPQEQRSLAGAFNLHSSTSQVGVRAQADRLNLLAGTFIRARMGDQGGKTPGIGDYYAVRAEKDLLLAVYEVRIAEALLADPMVKRVYEVGSGLSLLPMLLSLCGREATGIERDTARIAAARELREYLITEGKLDLSRSEIWGTAAPAALADVNGAGAAIIFTNISATISDDDVAAIIALAAGFSVIVIDLSRFFVARDTSEQVALLARLGQSGWTNGTPLAGTYWIFRPS
jgi:hypothetical protein